MVENCVNSICIRWQSEYVGDPSQVHQGPTGTDHQTLSSATGDYVPGRSAGYENQALVSCPRTQQDVPARAWNQTISTRAKYATHLPHHCINQTINIHLGGNVAKWYCGKSPKAHINFNCILIICVTWNDFKLSYLQGYVELGMKFKLSFQILVGFLSTSCMFLSTWKKFLSTFLFGRILSTSVRSKIKTKRKRTWGKLENI